MIKDLSETARLAQEAMRANGALYRKGLEADIFRANNEAGVKKILEFAKECRAKALHTLSTGTKEKFDANQATYFVWNDLVRVIESGPKTTDVKIGESHDHA